MLIRKPTNIYRPAATPRPRTASDPCASPCPECGGLQCLCRPRFFAGQLLTDEDLNRLDQLLEPEALGFAQDRVADLVLETGIGVDDVPAGHG